MNFPNLLIALGVLIVGIGGIVATAGWNARSEAGRREGLINTIAAETSVNVQTLRGRAYSETDPTELQKPAILPRLQFSGLQSAIASGFLFADKDRELLTRLSRSVAMMHDFNNRVGIVEEQLLRLQGERIADIRAKLRDAPVKVNLEAELVQLLRLLLEDYGVDGSRRYFINLDQEPAQPR